MVVSKLPSWIWLPSMLTTRFTPPLAPVQVTGAVYVPLASIKLSVSAPALVNVLLASAIV